MKMMLKVVLVSMIACSFALGQIANSAHDFSGDGWNTEGEQCNVCHTPHNAAASVSPLWNHTVTSASFNPYASSTLDATVPTPDGASKLCLSCHDGTVAVDSYGGATGATSISSGADLGSDLTNDHPISFTYDATLATTDGGLVDPSNTSVAALLTAGKMECSSCHDVHNGSGESNLLVMSNAGSALCLTCHSK